MASVYDQRMEEIARMKEAERNGLDRIEESTQTINRGMADPLNWLLCIGAIVGIPFSGGLSIGLGVVAILRATAGGKAVVQAVTPTVADVSAPGPGCVRILAASGVAVVTLIIVFLFAVALYMNAAGIPLK